MAPGEEPEPEFKAKMNEVYNTCYELSQSIPQSVLDKKGPMMKQFGRQKCFFKCCHVSTINIFMYVLKNIHRKKKLNDAIDIFRLLNCMKNRIFSRSYRVES